MFWQCNYLKASKVEFTLNDCNIQFIIYVMFQSWFDIIRPPAGWSLLVRIYIKWECREQPVYRGTDIWCLVLALNIVPSFTNNQQTKDFIVSFVKMKLRESSQISFIFKLNGIASFQNLESFSFIQPVRNKAFIYFIAVMLRVNTTVTSKKRSHK